MSARKNPGRRPTLALLAASISVFALSPQTATADPATAMMVMNLAEGVLNLGGSKPDLTFEAIQQQTVMIQAVHQRLDKIEETLGTILSLVAALPEQTKKLLEADRDVNRSETLSGWIYVIDGIAADLRDAVKRGDKKRTEELQTNLRKTVYDLRATRASLADRSDFVLPTLVISLTAEMNALAMLPKNGEEIPRELTAYYQRFAMMLDETRTDSLIATRLELEKLQATQGKELAKAITGTEGDLVAGQWPWYAHTLVATRQVPSYEPSVGTPGSDDYQPPRKGFADEDYDLHTRTWSRSITLTPVSSAAGAGVYTVAVSVVGPEESPGSVANATPHKDADTAYEARYVAANDLSPAINQFNARAGAIAALRDLEQIAVSAQILIASWDGAKATALAKTASKVSDRDIHAMVASPAAVAIQNEVKTRIDGMDTARKQAWADIEAANKRFEEAVAAGKKDKWKSDILMGIQVVRLSMQAQELGERLGLLASTTKTDVAKPAAKEASTKPKAKVGTTGNDAAQMALAGLSDTEKAKLIERIIYEVGKAPSTSWSKLPDDPTLEESKIALGITLLNSMGESASGKLNSTYGGEVSKAGSSKTSLIIAAILPTPASAETFVDDMSQRDMRKRLNALAKPFALRRVEQMMSGKVQKP